jgi:hypothetical protein
VFSAANMRRSQVGDFQNSTAGFVLLLYDLTLKRRQQAQQLILFGRRHLELVEGSRQILHDAVKSLWGDRHACVNGFQIRPTVLARSSRGLADEIRQAGLVGCRGLRVGGKTKPRVNPLVFFYSFQEPVDYGADRRHPAQPFV